MTSADTGVDIDGEGRERHPQIDHRGLCQCLRLCQGEGRIMEGQG